jgi:hypothetical protein
VTPLPAGSRCAIIVLALVVTVGAACASSPAAEKTIEPTATEDSAFVLSRNPPAAAARPVAEKPPVHVGDLWWPFRADFLKTSEDKARERDNDVSERQAPAGFWDLQTSVETISIWTTFCNECHGGRRKLEDVVRMPTPSPTWGRGEGLFFGLRRPYAEISRIVYNGKIEKEGNRWKMPAWRGKLAKEEIWALIYFVEYQSGGIEGRFPPSLYPRESAEHQ